MVNDAVIKFETSITSKIEENAVAVAAPPATTAGACTRGSKMCKYASLAALTLGGIGWLGSAALWSKMLTVGGFAGLAYSLLNAKSAKSQNQSQYQTRQSTETYLSPGFIVARSSVLIEELKKIANLWLEFAESNKSILVQIINDESLIISSHERFKLESFIRVPKTLSFPLIEYRNIIEDASTPDKLKKAFKEVAESAIAEIDRVVNSQVSAYKEINGMISATLS